MKKLNIGKANSDEFLFGFESRKKNRQRSVRKTIGISKQASGRGSAKNIIKALDQALKAKDLGWSEDAGGSVLIGPEDGPLPIIELFPDGTWVTNGV
ncbi:MAG TPA: hypothetical protein ENI23_17665 [bacterium]|nr:hypothetical protein [bacterium]